MMATLGVATQNKLSLEKDIDAIDNGDVSGLKIGVASDLNPKEFVNGDVLFKKERNEQEELCKNVKDVSGSGFQSEEKEEECINSNVGRKEGEWTESRVGEHGEGQKEENDFEKEVEIKEAEHDANEKQNTDIPQGACFNERGIEMEEDINGEIESKNVNNGDYNNIAIGIDETGGGDKIIKENVITVENKETLGGEEIHNIEKLVEESVIQKQGGLGDIAGLDEEKSGGEILFRKRLTCAVKEGEDARNGLANENREKILSQLNVPVQLPDILEIKRALPAHCFVPSVMTSLYFMAKDFALVAIIYLIAEWSWRVLPATTQFVITPLVWLLQGVIFTGIFVVGHDAGHGSFSSSSWINDICGNLCHAFLFCPYFMWKLSHRNHHKNTGNMDKEEVYYPVKQTEAREFYSRIMPGFGLGVGWFTYLWQGYRPRGVDHYNPFHPMFQRHVKHCVMSLVFLGLWAFCLYQYAITVSFVSLVYHWVIPVLVFGSFIVIITFLHHSDVEVPWYSDPLWSYVRGQLSSVDRHYGWCHHLIHHIGTHQIHHLFPMIPHYHLEEATEAFRKKFPTLVRINNEAILPAFYTMFKKYAKQNVIADHQQVHVYK